MPSSDSYVSIRRHAIAPWQFKHRMLPWRDNTFALARPRLQSMMDSARHIWLHEVDHTHTGCNESADRQPNRLMSESSHAMCSYLGSKKGHHIHEKLQSHPQRFKTPLVCTSFSKRMYIVQVTNECLLESNIYFLPFTDPHFRSSCPAVDD